MKHMAQGKFFFILVAGYELVLRLEKKEQNTMWIKCGHIQTLKKKKLLIYPCHRFVQYAIK